MRKMVMQGENNMGSVPIFYLYFILIFYTFFAFVLISAFFVQATENAEAKNILDASLNEVEAQNGKHLTSEAYALLKYNVQYLVERL